MPEIVTLAEAKLFLRVDGDADDDTIILLIAAATETALSYADGFEPSAAEIPARLKLAVLAHVAQAFEDRSNGAAAPEGACRLLYPFRVLEL